MEILGEQVLLALMLLLRAAPQLQLHTDQVLQPDQDCHRYWGIHMQHLQEAARPHNLPGLVVQEEVDREPKATMAAWAAPPVFLAVEVAAML